MLAKSRRYLWRKQMETVATLEAESGWYVKIDQETAVSRLPIAAWDFHGNGLAVPLIEEDDGGLVPSGVLGRVDGVFHAELQPEPGDPTHDPGRHAGDSSSRASRLQRWMDSTPWGDVHGFALTLEQSLALAIQATGDDFWLWEREAERNGLRDEFSVSAGTVELMSDRWRLAYVARLIRTAAMTVGVPTEFSGDGALAPERASLGGLLRELESLVDTRGRASAPSVIEAGEGGR